MKREFKDRLTAIQWIAEFAKSEAEFEVLREELSFNYMYQQRYFIHARRISEVVVWLEE